MTDPERETPTETLERVNDLFESLEMTQAIDADEFTVYLDHIPIALVISKLMRGDQRIVYAKPIRHMKP